MFRYPFFQKLYVEDGAPVDPEIQLEKSSFPILISNHSVWENLSVLQENLCFMRKTNVKQLDCPRIYKENVIFLDILSSGRHSLATFCIFSMWKLNFLTICTFKFFV